MHTRGASSFESMGAARDRWEALGRPAQSVVREIARAMDFDRDEYADRVTAEVVETAREVLFASELEVTVGTREDFETWRDSYEGSVTTIGHEAVDQVVWHVGPAETAVAATFQTDEDAAVETLRRQAIGRLYRPEL